MIRFICFLLGKPYEPCKSCETLERQNEFLRAEKRELTATLMAILKPAVYEAPATVLEPIATTAGNFARRRAILEAKDREEASVIKNSKHLAKPDSVLADKKNISIVSSIENLEAELNIEPEAKEG